MELPLEWEAMLLSTLDGFLAAMLVCPETIPEQEWLPHVWGEENAFDDAERRQALTGLVCRHRDRLAADLKAGEPFLPILDIDGDEVLWETWIEGFAAAFALRPDAWGTFLEADAEVRDGLTTLMVLMEVDAGESDLSDEEIAGIEADACDLIGESIDFLHAWNRGETWRYKTPVPYRAPPRIGRNDPCPCGSGKKYKRCHGASSG